MGTITPSRMDEKLILPLKTLTRKMASRWPLLIWPVGNKSVFICKVTFTIKASGVT
jgi:hypothetical protein